MTTRARQGLGWALLGLVMFVLIAVVAFGYHLDGTVVADAVINLLLLVALVLFLGGLAVAAASLIRRRS